MKKFILCIIGIGLLIYLLPFMLRGDLDILNPLAEKKNVYAVVEGYGVPDYHANGRAMYGEQKGDNASLITPKAQQDETVKVMEEWLLKQ